MEKKILPVLVGVYILVAGTLGCKTTKNPVSQDTHLSSTTRVNKPPHPDEKSVTMIMKEKCRLCHIEPGKDFKAGYLYHKVCWQCHGDPLHPPKRINLFNKTFLKFRNYEELYHSIAEGDVVNGMPAFLDKKGGRGLTEEQIKSLVEFIRSYEAMKSISSYETKKKVPLPMSKPEVRKKNPVPKTKQEVRKEKPAASKPSKKKHVLKDTGKAVMLVTLPKGMIPKRFENSIVEKISRLMKKELSDKGVGIKDADGKIPNDPFYLARQEGIKLLIIFEVEGNNEHTNFGNIKRRISITATIYKMPERKIIYIDSGSKVMLAVSEDKLPFLRSVKHIMQKIAPEISRTIKRLSGN